MKISPRLAHVLRDTILGLVRQDAPDLTARQLATLLVCCLEDGPHTMSGLAERLGVSRPVITRAADRLVEFGFVKRVDDARDRRSVLLEVTASGRLYVEELKAIMVAAAVADMSAEVLTGTG
jgi:DNA-binding MarR family transcriptional regulator